MLLNCKFGFVEVVIGDSFQFGRSRWRVENFDLEYVFPTKQAPAGTVAVLCSIIEGEPRADVVSKMRETEDGNVLFLSGCSVAALCYLDWAREFELTNMAGQPPQG